MSNIGADEAHICDICGERSAHSHIVNHEFTYGPPASQVTLRAQVPVWQCSACDLEYTDSAGEMAKHEAICRHLDRAAPKEVAAVRAMLGVTQGVLAEKLGVGIASVKRWEAGTVVPNRSATVALRSLRESVLSERPFEPVFQTEISPEAQEAAKSFKLRGWIEEVQD